MARLCVKNAFYSQKHGSFPAAYAAVSALRQALALDCEEIAIENQGEQTHVFTTREVMEYLQTHPEVYPLTLRIPMQIPGAYLPHPSGFLVPNHRIHLPQMAPTL